MAKAKKNEAKELYQTTTHTLEEMQNYCEEIRDRAIHINNNLNHIIYLINRDSDKIETRMMDSKTEIQAFRKTIYQDVAILQDVMGNAISTLETITQLLNDLTNGNPKKKLDTVDPCLLTNDKGDLCIGKCDPDTGAIYPDPNIMWTEILDAMDFTLKTPHAYITHFMIAEVLHGVDAFRINYHKDIEEILGEVDIKITKLWEHIHDDIIVDIDSFMTANQLFRLCSSIGFTFTVRPDLTSG